MAASHSGEVLSVSEGEGFNLRLKVYTDTSKSEKTANKRNFLSILRHFLTKMPPPFQRRLTRLQLILFVYVSATLSTVKGQPLRVALIVYHSESAADGDNIIHRAVAAFNGCGKGESFASDIKI